jgi:hypothetical protein
MCLEIELWNLRLPGFNGILFIIFWKTQTEASGQFPQFTYHRKSSYIQLWIVILFVLVIETFAIHTLLSGWQAVLSYVFLGLSIYTLLFLIADLRAAVKRPVVVTDKELFLRTGIRWRVTVPLNNLLNVIKFKDKLNDKTVVNTALRRNEYTDYF